MGRTGADVVAGSRGPARTTTTRRVVLIGGANGAGKTHLARRLSVELGMDHRLGTGFIREVVRSETDMATDPDLFAHTFQGADPIGRTTSQALRIKPAVAACVERGLREGTSLIVEGNHLVPRLYAATWPAEAHYVVLAAPRSRVEHRRRVAGSSHSARHVSEPEFDAIIAMDRWYVCEAVRLGVPVFDDAEPLLQHLLAPGDGAGLVAGDTSGEAGSVVTARHPG